MDSLIKIAVLAIAGGTLGLVIKKSNAEIALLLAVAIVCVLLGLAVRAAGELVDFIRTLADTAGLSRPAVGIVFKTAAIAVTAKLTSDVFRDAGQGAAATAAEFCGACFALVTALPLLQAVLDLITGLV